MYWNINHQSSPQIETVLAKEDLTLVEILDQENILQELKSSNSKLIDFITRGDILEELITLIIEQPNDELTEEERYVRPNLACEVLTTDIPRLNESLCDISYLTKLYSFLENDPPLNPLLASYFSRTLSLLICRNSDQNWYSYQLTCLKVLDFLKSRPDSLKLLLKHLGTSAIMDLTLKLIAQVEGAAMQQTLINWLENEGLITSIIELFHPSVETDRQFNAAQLLCDTIRKFRERELNVRDNPNPDPILEAIQSSEIISKLLEVMLDNEEVTDSSIAGGVSVLLTLLEPPFTENPGRRNPYTNEDSSGGSVGTNKLTNPAQPTIVSAVVPFLPKLHNLLINPPKRNPIRLSSGVIDPPLGNTRLTVIKLISALISTNSTEVNSKLDELNTVQVLLDLFFRYTWNNFLHSQVDKCLAFALNSSTVDTIDDNPLISNIFIKCRLLQRILVAWEENQIEQTRGGRRKGYMGHLINIANSIMKHEKGDLSNFFRDNIDLTTKNEWDRYLETSLAPVNEIHSRFLGGVHPSQIVTTDEMQFTASYDSKCFTAEPGPDDLSREAHPPAWETVIDNFSRDSGQMRIEKAKLMFEELCITGRESSDLDSSAEEKNAWDVRGALELPSNQLRGDFYPEDEEVWEDLVTRAQNDGISAGCSGSSSDDDEKPPQELSNPIGVWSEPTDPWGTYSTVNADTNSDGWADFDKADFHAPPQEQESMNEPQNNPATEPIEHSGQVSDKLIISPSTKEDTASESEVNAEGDAPMIGREDNDANDSNGNLKGPTEAEKDSCSKSCSSNGAANRKHNDVSEPEVDNLPADKSRKSQSPPADEVAARPTTPHDTA